VLPAYGWDSQPSHCGRVTDYPETIDMGDKRNVEGVLSFLISAAPPIHETPISIMGCGRFFKMPRRAQIDTLGEPGGDLSPHT
jgi:hypothetical protein